MHATQNKAVTTPTVYACNALGVNCLQHFDPALILNFVVRLPVSVLLTLNRDYASVNGMYIIEVADQCGVFLERASDGFYEALQIYRELQRLYPDCVVRVTNTNYADVGFAGLTEEEWEALS